MAPSFSGVWKLQTKYQYNSAFPIDLNLLPNGLFAGGTPSSNTDVVDQIKPDSAGNATDFGDLLTTRNKASGGGSDTRFIVAGGTYTGSDDNVIQYMTYATSGNATDFGDLANSSNSTQGSSISNNVRYIHTFGVTSGTSGEINYFTIASTGNATDFGDQTATFYLSNVGNISSTTRGIIGGSGNSTYDRTIHYLTIASTGNTVDFGDLTDTTGGGTGKKAHAGMSSATRGLFAGGHYLTTYLNIIDYITIASTGNATDFGDLTVARAYLAGLSSSTRGVVGGGAISDGTVQNVIDFITIASTGDATDFGDLTVARTFLVAGGAGQASVQNESYFTPAAMSLIHHGTLVSGPGRTGVSYIDIATTGRLAMFGDVSGPSSYVISGGAASTTRGVLAGIHTASGSNGDDLEFFTFSTKGKSTDFGDATQNLYGSMGSSSTRGVMQVGYDGGASYTVNIIEYITIASAGDTTDFGDLTEGGSRSAPAGSTTRLLFMGRDAYGTGTQHGSTTVDYVTIASTGNATDFGDLSTAVHYAAGVSSNTRAVKCGGWSNSNTTAVNEMDYFTIASTGNATDFGDLTVARGGMVGCSSKIRGVLGTGANATGGTTDVLDYITIASTGNATDWGDWYATHSLNRFAVGSASNSHGGLS